jgi:hypothetical protein
MGAPAYDAYAAAPPAVAAYSAAPASSQFRQDPPVSDGVLIAGAVVLAVLFAVARRVALRM